MIPSGCRRRGERGARAGGVRSQALAGALRSRCQAHLGLRACGGFGQHEPGLLPAGAGACRAEFPGLPAFNNLNCLLETLAWCPRLNLLALCITEDRASDKPFPDVPAFAKLRSLRMLHLSLQGLEPHFMANLVDALVPLTGFTRLSIEVYEPTVLPAALRQLKGLQTLDLLGLKPCSLRSGCLDLPNLQALRIEFCKIENAAVLTRLSALHSLTCLEFSGGQVPPFIAQRIQAPRLQRLVLRTGEPCHGGAPLGLSRLPADMGSALLHLDITGHGLTQFPLSLTQLAALECLRACCNEFAVLPAGMTALSRLTELGLGRIMSWTDPLQLRVKRPLDVRALGDLSGFPALCRLVFTNSEVMMCASMLGAVRHASLACLYFYNAHPAPECAPVVLQLGQDLRRLGRGGVLRSRIFGQV